MNCLWTCSCSWMKNVWWKSIIIHPRKWKLSSKPTYKKSKTWKINFGWNFSMNCLWTCSFFLDEKGVMKINYYSSKKIENPLFFIRKFSMNCLWTCSFFLDEKGVMKIQLLFIQENWKPIVLHSSKHVTKWKKNYMGVVVTTPSQKRQESQ